MGLIVLLLSTSGCVENAESDASITDTPEKTTVKITATTNAVSSTAQKQPTTARNAPNESLSKELALKQEKRRVKRVLRNATGIRGNASVGVYGRIDASVVNRTGDAVVVDVVMSYSYGFTCDGGGSLDGATTKTTYVVTDDGASLEDVHEDVFVYCEGLTDLTPPGR